MTIEPGRGEGHSAWNPRTLLAIVAFAAVVGVSIGIAAGGSGSGGTATTGAASRITTIAPAGTAPVSLELRTKKLVWVCLIKERNRPVINGLNLIAGQTVGPYDGRAFEVSFGNGSIDLTVNGKPVDIPPIAAPLGYRITPDGVSRLPPLERPSCT